jgi:peptidoglycan/xylan/chitin deacetylase (PgdA/CDA1 family)
MAVSLREKLLDRWIWRLPPRSGAVALTFDDGPDPQTTSMLLAELQRLQIPSTHFLIGAKAAAASHLIREIASAGHVIANHAFRHESFLLRSGNYQHRSILAADRAIAQTTGNPCCFFRPCFGQINLRTQSVVERLGYVGVMWSVIASDWVEQTDEQLWQRLEAKLHEGAIIVLHDAHPTTSRVIRLLPRLADAVRKRGWTFVPLTPSALISGNDT